MLLVVGVVSEIILFVVFRWTGKLPIAASLLLAWIAIAVVRLAVPWNAALWAHQPAAAARYLRAALAWLLVSLLLFMALPLYQAITGIAFSHAYYAASLHAAMVGFVTMAAIGLIESHLDRPESDLSIAPFLLLNFAVAMQVYIQILTDFHPAAFSLLVPVSAVELAALAWWGLPALGRLAFTNR